jgi:hypothetical protein
MPATRLDFGLTRNVPPCAQGETFDRTITYKDAAGAPIDLSGYSARMMVCPAYGAAAALVFDTADGSIVLGGAEGTIRLVKSVADLAGLPVPQTGVTGSAVPAQTQFVYDLVLTSAGGVAVRLIEGVFVVTAAATR